jgi:hypothetical protein
VLESITQVFPADFHIETIYELFGVLPHLEDQVQTLGIITGVILRLQSYYRGEGADAGSAIATVRLVTFGGLDIAYMADLFLILFGYLAPADGSLFPRRI